MDVYWKIWSHLHSSSTKIMMRGPIVGQLLCEDLVYASYDEMT